ncbi:hypothetical protein IAQ67_16430 [Paenibacillus peoriae]|uniref:Uncharacterized protein n=1 Tax=Paenibacillus peoriae TaxID=59893 RepID=A0A7H0Y315_9BACL|nr:hypothetical protein [Paenibacillus peoriae]QNR65473.1 hypothetical protein IAQ67_16430 [Paenibacillus peoriae]
MEFLERKDFQFNKTKYRYTVETDGLSLELSCINLATKKLEKLNKLRDLQESIYSQLNKQHGSVVARNIVYEPDKIRVYTRRVFNIGFPTEEEKRLSTLASELIQLGVIELNGNIDLFVDYLEMNEIKTINTNYKNSVYCCSNQQGVKSVSLKIKDDIKALQNQLDALKRINEKLSFEAEELPVQ